MCTRGVATANSAAPTLQCLYSLALCFACESIVSKEILLLNTRFFVSLSLSYNCFQFIFYFLYFKQADMPCLDCLGKELKSLLTFAVAPLSHARVCKETFSDGVSACAGVRTCVCRLWHQF